MNRKYYTEQEAKFGKEQAAYKVIAAAFESANAHAKIRSGNGQIRICLDGNKTGIPEIVLEIK